MDFTSSKFTGSSASSAEGRYSDPPEGDPLREKKNPSRAPQEGYDIQIRAETLRLLYALHSSAGGKKPLCATRTCCLRC